MRVTRTDDRTFPRTSLATHARTLSGPPGMSRADLIGFNPPPMPASSPARPAPPTSFPHRYPQAIQTPPRAAPVENSTPPLRLSRPTSTATSNGLPLTPRPSSHARSRIQSVRSTLYANGSPSAHAAAPPMPVQRVDSPASSRSPYAPDSFVPIG